MTLSKMRLIQLGGVAVFLICVALLVATFSAQVKVTVTPANANADGGGAKASHISGYFTPDAAGQTFGAATGPDRFSPDGCETVNGNKNCFAQQRFTNGTSTLAQFRTPSSTSTVAVACQQFTNTLASVIQIGWGASRGATTTVLAQNIGAANIPYSIVATTTNSTAAIQGGTDGAIPPNTWINVNLATTTGVASITVSPTGSCSAQFRVL